MLCVTRARDDVGLLKLVDWAQLSDFFGGLVTIFERHADVHENEWVPAFAAHAYLLKLVDCLLPVISGVNEGI